METLFSPQWEVVGRVKQDPLYIKNKSIQKASIFFNNEELQSPAKKVCKVEAHSARRTDTAMASVSRGKLKPDDEACIRNNYVFLKDHLYQGNVIDKNDVENIRLGTCRSEKNENVLRISLSNGPWDSYKLFLKSLEKGFTHVREQLLKSAGKGSGSAPTQSNKATSQLSTDVMTFKRRGHLQPEDYDCIHRNYTYRREELDAKELVDFLYPEKILDHDDIESRRKGKTTSERSTSFLNISCYAFWKYLTQIAYKYVPDKLTQSSSAHITSDKSNDLAKDEYDVEVDLESNKMNKCDKCSDHSKFIPILQLDMGDLPEKYRNEDLINTIKTIGQLTVQVKVNCMSDVKLGSGRVLNVVENKTTRLCPCRKCQNSPKWNRRLWNVIVLTSSHVVFDENEAKISSCRLFYDSDNSEIITVKGVGILNSFTSTDMRKMTCTTCDKDLVDTLSNLLNKLIVLHERVFDKFWDAKNKEKLVVIVSHPHGLSQRVSIGKSDKTVKLSEGLNTLTYTTDTCPGSTGAYLYVL